MMKDQEAYTAKSSRSCLNIAPLNFGKTKTFRPEAPSSPRRMPMQRLLDASEEENDIESKSKITNTKSLAFSDVTDSPK